MKKSLIVFLLSFATTTCVLPEDTQNFVSFDKCENGAFIIEDAPCKCEDNIYYSGYCCNGIWQQQECEVVYPECKNNENITEFEICLCEDEVRFDGYCCNGFWQFDNCEDFHDECADGKQVDLLYPCLCDGVLKYDGYCCDEVWQEGECEEPITIPTCSDGEDIEVLAGGCYCGLEITLDGFCCDEVWQEEECEVPITIPTCSDGEDIKILADGCYCNAELKLDGFCCDEQWQTDICLVIKSYIKEGGRPDWSSVLPFYPEGRLAFDRRTGDHKFYDVHLMNPELHDPADSANPEYYDDCLTCDLELPVEDRFDERHFGTASWHPSGEFLVFNKSMSWNEIEELPHGVGEIYLLEFHEGSEELLSRCEELSDDDAYADEECNSAFGTFRYRINAGQGLFNNLYFIRPDGSDYKKVTWCYSDELGPGDEGRTGLLHPHFSHDGIQTKILWSEKLEGSDQICVPDFGQSCPDLSPAQWDSVEWGRWELRVADFTFDDEGDPCVGNIQSFNPGDQKYYYETHGFSSDDKKIIFSGNLESLHGVFYADIYSFDLETEEILRLTETFDDWDEHAHFSPSGKWVAWMTSTEVIDMREEVYSGDYQVGEQFFWQGILQTDVWIMREDGSDKMRLTSFNLDGHSDYLGRAISSDMSWSPDGTRLVVSVMVKSLIGGGYDLTFGHPTLKIIEFKKPM